MCIRDRPITQVDQPSGRPLAQESAKSTLTEPSLVSSERAGGAEEMVIDAAGVRDRGQTLNLDSDTTTALTSELADTSTSPRAEQSIQGTTEIADTGGQDAAYPFASSRQADTNASIQAIESLPSNGPDKSNPIPAANQNNCLLYTSPSPRDLSTSRMPSSA